MTDYPVAHELAEQRPFTLDELARAQHVTPRRTVDELLAQDLWESDDELSAFLGDLTEARHAHSA